MTIDDFVFDTTSDRFITKRDGAWNLREPITERGLRSRLKDRGWEPETINDLFKNNEYTSVDGYEMVPNGETLHRTASGEHYLNLWVAPTLVPVQGSYPSIQAAIDWLTDGDAAGAEWLKHWMAFKVQNPGVVPKVSVVFSTQPGGGKGFLGVTMRHMLGFENTAIIGRKELESKFNVRWITKLFVLADEVLADDNLKDISDRLKMLVDGNELEIEGKGTNQHVIKSRLSFMFASNHLSPLLIEEGDRRYTVFTNQNELPPGYQSLLDACFEVDRVTATPAFERELAGFYYDMLHLPVNRALVTRPYANESRGDMITASLPGHAHFFAEVEAEGIEHLLEDKYKFSTDRDSWDFAENGIRCDVLYEAYVAFCKANGNRPTKSSRFSGAVKNKRGKTWLSKRIRPGKSRRQVTTYIVPRETDLDESPTPTLQ